MGGLSTRASVETPPTPACYGFAWREAKRAALPTEGEGVSGHMPIPANTRELSPLRRLHTDLSTVPRPVVFSPRVRHLPRGADEASADATGGVVVALLQVRQWVAMSPQRLAERAVSGSLGQSARETSHARPVVPKIPPRQSVGCLTNTQTSRRRPALSVRGPLLARRTRTPKATACRDLPLAL